MKYVEALYDEKYKTWKKKQMKTFEKKKEKLTMFQDWQD